MEWPITWRFMLMVFNATSNNISAISWWSALLVEETGENHRPVASHWQTLSHKCCIEYTSPWKGFELATFVVIGTYYTGSYKSNYHTITTRTAPITWSWLCFWSIYYTSWPLYHDFNFSMDLLSILGNQPIISLHQFIQCFDWMILDWEEY